VPALDIGFLLTAHASWLQISSNSAISEGWTVRCTCGATEDDGEELVECGGGCKTWQHTRCVLGPCAKLARGAAFLCTWCREKGADAPSSAAPAANVRLLCKLHPAQRVFL
jgi:hypothetical protein